MKIIKGPRFNIGLKDILQFISLDSKKNAKVFKNELLGKINNLADMPYQCRQSRYFKEESVRDMIYKGYTIVYEIDEKHEKITIVGIKKYKENF